MNAAEQSAAQRGSVTQVPVALGGEGVAYNLNLPADARLHLTGPVLARIFFGQITNWHDPAITALNPASTSPTRRSPSSTAPTAAAPPTSSATTCPPSPPPGRPRSAPARPSAGRSGKAPKATGASPLPCSGPRSPSDTSSKHMPGACSCPSPPSATRPETTSSPLPRPSPPTPRKNQLSPRLTSPSSTSPGPAATPSAATAGRSSTPTSTARPPGKTRQHAGLAHPRRPGLRRRERLCPPPTPHPGPRPCHAPADHRPQRAAPTGLSAIQQGACPPSCEALTATRRSGCPAPVLCSPPGQEPRSTD